MKGKRTNPLLNKLMKRIEKIKQEQSDIAADLHDLHEDYPKKKKEFEEQLAKELEEDYKEECTALEEENTQLIEALRSLEAELLKFQTE